MTPEEIRLRDEAIAAGRVVRVQRKVAPLKAVPDYPARVGQPGSQAKPPSVQLSAGVKRVMSIQRALEWAFGTERAQLEFDEIGETSGGQRLGVDGIWLMMQRGAIGCEIDGGGRSDPAWDAEIIASAVASLPAGHGGRQMAVFVAEHARAGTVPDWMRDARPRIQPCGMRTNRYGERSITEDAQHLGGEGWPIQRRIGRKGRVHEEPVLYCPVVITPTGSQIAAAHRRYLGWYGALLWIRAELDGLGILSGIELTLDMPPLKPWIAR
ncbi:hypothetical protein [Pseudogemmobacter faecipullorum]|nr:hypothetical protein [Pseudogemmobacter faecipullorum]